MENINGEKTFRVIEAQTDIAQKIEEGVYQVSGHPELGKFSSKTEALNAAEKIHPIVKQWERLTVKAAIDHALSEGATKVVFDDAKTAMMTEGHDRHAFSTHQEDFVSRKNAEIAAKDTQETTGVAQQVIPSTTQEGKWTFRAIPKPVQEPGMTLHYDRILPKLGEELTGSKGEKVEMGEHKMAFVDERAYDRAPSEAEVTGLRKDLIFRNPDGTPKTTSTGMAFDLSKVKGKDWSILQSDKVKAEKPGGIGGGIQRAVEGGHRSEEGAVNLQMVKDAIDAVFTKVGEGIHAIPELFKSDEFRSAVNRFSGVAAPKTTTRMPIVGNQLVMMAKADDISHAVSTDLANQVLGKYVKDEDFRRRLGFVGAEDRFRREGKSMIGTPQAQGITEQQYQQWLHAPDIRAALDRHRQLVQPGALARHQALGGKVAAGGAETDAFFNLIPVEATGQSKAMVGSSKGQLATLKKGSAFGRQFKGSADTYDFDYQHMMDRMVRGNWAEVEKQKLYNLVEGTGFGKIQKSGQARPAGVEDMEGIPIQRKQVVYSKQGKPAKNVVQNETMWVPKASAEEFRQAFQVNSPMKSWLSTFGRAVTEVQVSLGVDAAVHITNQSAALLTRIVKDPKPIKQVQGIVKDIGRALTKDPGFTHELAVLAEKYGIVRSGEADERSLLRKILQPGSGLVHTLDKVSRVALNRMYQDAVDRGVAPDERIWRRAAVHGAIGEYNKALLDHWQQTVKEMGISPFLVAGLNFNRLAIRQAIMSPGIKTTSAVEGAKLRARAAISTAVIAMMLPSIMNYFQKGSILPPGVKVGQGVVHKNKDGTYETIDFAKWLMQRRAFDITGVDALATGIEQGQSAKQIAGKMGGQILRGAVRPYAGPAISAALMATKGEDLLGYRKSKDKSAGEKLKAAGKELNPMTATVLGGSTSDIGGRVEQRLGKTIGVGRSQSPISMVKSMAIDFNEREGQPVEDRPASQYKELSNALRSGDASAVRSSVAELQKKGVANATIKKYYDELPYKNLTGRDAAAESRFVGQLTADQKKVYDQVAAQEFDAQRNFYNIVLQRPAPPRRMPKRQARPKRGVEFPGEGVQEEP
jgi:hypothetical protein